MIVYLSIGSNYPQKISIIQKVLTEISFIPKTRIIKISNLYLTTPVSDIKQENFINACLSVNTTLNLKTLFEETEKIEIKNNKKKKPKNHPRPIDIDILFSDSSYFLSKALTIPHIDWKNRLFVLKPLSDIISSFYFIDHSGKNKFFDLKSYLKKFKSPYNETVILYKEKEKL